MNIPALLPLILLIEGFVSIAVEILTIRQLLPVVGGSVIVTSLIIGIFLLFLALGYQQGGKLKVFPQKNLQRNFLIASIWIGFGLSYPFIGCYFELIQKILGKNLIYPLISYLLLIIAPLIYLLGQTVPITMNMAQQKQAVGIIGGNTLSISTIGSFLGATATSLILMHYLGVAFTILFIVLLLLLLVMLLTLSWQEACQYGCAVMIITFVVYGLNVHMEQRFFIFTNHYANYQLLDHTNSKLRAGEKILVINEAFSSHTDKNKHGFPYVEVIKKILFHDLQLKNADILILGAGGFSLSENNDENNFTYVDVDPQIMNAAVPHFISAFKNALITDDARHFLKSQQQNYDVIIADAYSDIKSLPAHLLTVEYMREVKARLRERGLAIFNIIANPFLTDAYSKHIDNTIHLVFKNCMSLPLSYKNEVTNILYICHNAPNDADNKIYSDNLNNSTTENFNW